MPGRSVEERADSNRAYRTTIRWSDHERERLEFARKKLGLTYLVDVPRILTLQALADLFPEEPEDVAKSAP